MGTGSKLYEWFNSRVDLENILKFMKKKTVPYHRHSLWYYVGGMCLYLFIIQVLTGILLLLYYKPTAEAAFESVQYIMTEVPFGWLIRSIHSYAANLFIGFVVFLMKGYRQPRELTWVSGVFLLFLAMAFGFSGYLLPWNQLAYLATNVGTNFAVMVPFIGDWLLEFMRTLTRFFGFHVAVLPGICTALLGVHLILVQRHGMSVPISVEKEIKSGKAKRLEIPFVPNFLYRDILGWTLALGLIVLLSWELGEKADILKPAPPHVRPEWFFVFMYQTLKYVPKALGVFGFAVAALIWIICRFSIKNPIAASSTGRLQS
jgi:cytochrome b6